MSNRNRKPTDGKGGKDHAERSKPQQALSISGLRTVRQVSEMNPAFSEAGLRWLIFNSEQNGLDRALVKVGSRIFFDLPEFEQWLEERRVGHV